MRIIYNRQHFNVMCKISTFLPVNKICFCDIMLLLEAALTLPVFQNILKSITRYNFF